MKKVSLYSALLIAISSLSLQAMLFESPEALVKWYSSQPLSSIERALVQDEVKQNGQAVVRDKINQSPVLKIDQTFLKRYYDADPLTKQIFDEKEKVENNAKNTPKRDLVLPHNYFGLTTLYHARGSAIRVESTIYNKQEALQIVDSYKE